ncbi:hypothetical protein EON66_07700 [archaeon]|nr:MAG: hypothetical protein EON66_07700 [archaeon]
MRVCVRADMEPLVGAATGARYKVIDVIHLKDVNMNVYNRNASCFSSPLDATAAAAGASSSSLPSVAPVEPTPASAAVRTSGRSEALATPGSVVETPVYELIVAREAAAKDGTVGTAVVRLQFTFEQLSRQPSTRCPRPCQAGARRPGPLISKT